jgi:hypothetical protein
MEVGAARDWGLPCRRTALHLASESGHSVTAKALVVAGADVHCKDKNGYGRGYVPGQSTGVGREVVVCACVVSWGAAPSVGRLRSQWGEKHFARLCDGNVGLACYWCRRTALDFALENGHMETAKALQAAAAMKQADEKAVAAKKKALEKEKATKVAATKKAAEEAKQKTAEAEAAKAKAEEAAKKKAEEAAATKNSAEEAATNKAPGPTGAAMPLPGQTVTPATADWKAKNVRDWSIDDVLAFFTELELGEHNAAIAKNKVDGRTLQELLAENALDELGIKSKLHMIRIRRGLEKTTEDLAAGPAAPAVVRCLRSCCA